MAGRAALARMPPVLCASKARVWCRLALLQSCSSSSCWMMVGGGWAGRLGTARCGGGAALCSRGEGGGHRVWAGRKRSAPVNAPNLCLTGCAGVHGVGGGLGGGAWKFGARGGWLEAVGGSEGVRAWLAVGCRQAAHCGCWQAADAPLHMPLCWLSLPLPGRLLSSTHLLLHAAVLHMLARVTGLAR